MRCVLAIDGGTTTGWALWRPGLMKPRASTLNMPDTKNIAIFAGEMALWIKGFCNLEGVTEIVVESPIVVQHKDGEKCSVCGRSDTSINGTEIDKLFGIVHAVEIAAHLIELPCTRAPRSSVVKHIAGVGRGTRKQFKTYCLLGCQRRGWNVTSEDMADALATLDWYTFDRRIDVPWDNQAAAFPIFEGQKGVRIDDGNRRAAKMLERSALSFDRAKNGGVS